MKIDPNKLFSLTFKKTGLIILAWILAIILHNLFFALFNIEEAAFFILATIVIPLYFLACLFYSIWKLIKTKRQINKN
jgi:hypothetical protein